MLLCSFFSQVMDGSLANRTWLTAVTCFFMVVVFTGACAWVLNFYHEWKEQWDKVWLQNQMITSRGSKVVRKLASHQCGLGSIPRLGITYKVEFVGSLLCTERFVSGFSGFSLSSKATYDLVSVQCPNLVPQHLINLTLKWRPLL